MERFRRLPKVELHLHGDGACRLSTLFELSKCGQNGINFPADPEQFKPFVCCTGKQPSLQDFLKVFPNIIKIISTKENLKRIAYEFCEDCFNNNVIYAEYRYWPFAGVDNKLAPNDFIEAISDGLDEGQKVFKVKVRQILCFMRHKPEEAMQIVKLAVQYKSRGVVAVDIAGDETLPMDQRFIDAFRTAKEQGLHITVHAGESGPAANVKEAIESLGAERIGHGYHVIDDESVYKLARDSHVHFEACPTSSLFTSSQVSEEEHALKQFVADGTSFSLSTDDPGVMQCNIADEYILAEKMGLNEKQLIQSVFSAAHASFLPDEEKKQLLTELDSRMKLYAKFF
ncbi:hypothetical protein EMCRGX_G014828 [Ephydatia muelleri]